MAAYEPPSTSPTLLRLLALPGADEAWGVFIQRYVPLIDRRCREAGLQAADAQDIRATVFLKLATTLATFRHDPARRFRGYFQRVVDNAIRSHWRVVRRRPGWVGVGGASGGARAPPEPLARLGAELDAQIQARVGDVLRVVDRVRFDVGPGAWQAFWLT